MFLLEFVSIAYQIHMELVVSVMLCIREVTGSNLCRKPATLTETFSGFPQPIQTGA
jgi:hypothetical protein